MDIPVVARWVMLALAAWSLLLAVRWLLRARRAAPGHRTGPLLDAAGHGLGVVAMAGFALFGVQWVSLGAMALVLLLSPLTAWKDVRDHRAARAAKAAALRDTPRDPAPGPGSPGTPGPA